MRCLNFLLPLLEHVPLRQHDPHLRVPVDVRVIITAPVLACYIFEFLRQMFRGTVPKIHPVEVSLLHPPLTAVDRLEQSCLLVLLPDEGLAQAGYFLRELRAPSENRCN